VFERVLVANRGEIAIRVIRALHELGVEAVAVYSTADRNSLHTRLADRAVCIGPPSAAESYLNVPSLIGAAETTRCDAVHPGYGFLAENPAFVDACVDNDLVFVGPTADVMTRMGDKVEAKMELGRADVPLVPGTEKAVDPAEARQAAAELGYPVLLKACAGGGGKGMRLVASEDELEDSFGTAAAEADAAFGDGRLYVEKAVVPARHVEIQVLADAHGGVLTLGERECSIQRRHQKLVEESPSLALTAESREAMEAAAERAAIAVGYRNAGTFEFLVGDGGSFFFIELNARLQVEHPVSELVTGIDIVQQQLLIAAGESLEQTGRAERRGHAIEIRINAEDPTRGFAPAPGRLDRFRPPLGPGIRVDTFVEDGSTIPPYYDSLIAKLIVWGTDRAQAIARAKQALRELELEGVPTTREFAIDILSSEEFVSGRYTTSYLAEAEHRLPALIPR
jgi:acetyl-CoA carboxylase, biotin carboxylase subunit